MKIVTHVALSFMEPFQLHRRDVLEGNLLPAYQIKKVTASEMNGFRRQPWNRMQRPEGLKVGFPRPRLDREPQTVVASCAGDQSRNPKAWKFHPYGPIHREDIVYRREEGLSVDVRVRVQDPNVVGQRHERRQQAHLRGFGNSLELKLEHVERMNLHHPIDVRAVLRYELDSLEQPILEVVKQAGSVEEGCIPRHMRENHSSLLGRVQPKLGADLRRGLEFLASLQPASIISGIRPIATGEFLIQCRVLSRCPRP